MNSYLLFKSLHLIAIISWMAGLLYLPRIFVYHVENIKNENSSSIFKTMERKLYFYIMTPAMLLSWVFGLILISSLGLEVLSAVWIKVKLLLVVLLTLYHFYLSRLLSDFEFDQNTKSSKFFRIINEVPTILLILIVFIVVFKPI
ncbi:putative membrane protein [Candidatus Pelagibacter ubique]|uniref:Protoporphyrinogen IX oxidase n=1 Tax=Pelagibacter ubique TaxID=198252 RepID=A0ABX1SZM0_PELUQ|nr:protoporphyrinogen oxidase HemJ [Candidatus Pelagibacter ubique]NMN67287.1 putative membrane protein [Candidatus Pelagibacter ubique]